MPSTTLTWASSGNGVQTAATAIGMLTDLSTLITSYSANAAFNWQVAGSSLVTTPLYLVLSRKDGSAGRIAIMIFTAALTNIQPTIFDQLPTVNNVFIAFFPSGTGGTLSNLNSTTGTICGTDTGAVKVSPIAVVATSYAAGIVPYYFDSYDYCMFCWSNPTALTGYLLLAGAATEDSTGAVYNTTGGSGGNTLSAFTTTMWPYVPPSSLTLAGSGIQSGLRVNYTSGNNQQFFQWGQPGGWASVVHSSTDCILANDIALKAWFAPTQLMSTVQGQGVVLKLRQMGYGPGQTSPLFSYNTTGPVQQTVQMCNATLGSNIVPHVTNFKI